MSREPNQSDKGNSEQENEARGAGLPIPVGGSILQFLPAAAIAFDKDLKITAANRPAISLIHPGEYMDESLAMGTD